MRSISVVISNCNGKHFDHNLSISNKPGTNVPKAEAYPGLSQNLKGLSEKKNSFNRELKRYDSNWSIIDVAQKHASN